jgi:hypothetical protein
MPFSFTFNGSFTDLYNLATTVQSYARMTASGELAVSGRLLTIQGFKLSPSQNPAEANSASSHAGGKKPVPGEHLTGTVSASAYVLPPGALVTAGATSSGPAGAGTGSTPASSHGSSSASPAAATIKAAP